MKATSKSKKRRPTKYDEGGLHSHRRRPERTEPQDALGRVVAKYDLSANQAAFAQALDCVPLYRMKRVSKSQRSALAKVRRDIRRLARTLSCPELNLHITADVGMDDIRDHVPTSDLWMLRGLGLHESHAVAPVELTIEVLQWLKNTLDYVECTHLRSETQRQRESKLGAALPLWEFWRECSTKSKAIYRKSALNSEAVNFLIDSLALRGWHVSADEIVGFGLTGQLVRNDGTKSLVAPDDPQNRLL